MNILSKKISINFILFFFSCFSLNLVSANNGFNSVIKLEKHFKVESTFSGDFSKEKSTSFHLILTKNKKTKKYDTFIYLFDGNNTNKIGVLTQEKSHGINSFYKNGNILTLLISYKIKRDHFVKRVDIDVVSNKIKEHKAISNEDLLTSLRTDSKVYFVYKTKKELKVIVLSDLDINKETKYVFKKRNDEVKEYFNNTFVTAVKTDEFVANGAVSNARLYLSDSKLFFTKQDDNYTELLSFNISDDALKPSFKIFNNNLNRLNFKKNTSYVLKDKIFLLGLGKKEASFSVFNIDNQDPLNTVDLNDNLLTKASKGKDFVNIKEFLKQAAKNKHNATVTVNKSVNNKLNVRIDYVDVSYSYNYNWWWHHQWMFQMNQMHMNNVMHQVRSNIPTGFGPNQEEDSFVNFYKKNNEKVYFQFTINSDGNVEDQESKSIYKEIDKKKYIDKLADISNLKFESSCFINDEFRFISYNKSLKRIIIQKNSVK